MSEQKNIGIDRPSFLQRLVKQKMALVGGIVILLWLLVGLVSFFYTPYGPNEVNMAEKLLAPGAGHLMGTDNFGRDILSRMMCGARISLLLGFVAVCISLCIGIPLGAFSGYYEGKAGNLIMRVMDSLQAFPMLILVMSISVALGRNSFSAMLAVGIAGLTNFARLLYAQTLSVKQSAFIEGEHAIGLPRRDILVRHILPNCITPILVRLSLSLGSAILTVSSLSFLGIGVQPPTPEWGYMISDARGYILTGEWWMIFFPGLAIASLVLSFNLFGDGLRDALDYRTQ